MPVGLALLTLALAAALEAGGDALVRTGLHLSGGAVARLATILVGGVVLLLYGVLVNTPPWGFGRLLGVYVVFFFVAAQLIDLAVFGAVPRAPILVGGALIVAGGAVITVWR